ncbi:MAG: hypothetical protein WA777_04945 [Rhodanobacter sp.]
MVVGKNDKIEQRVLQTNRPAGENGIVTGSVQASDRVIPGADAPP